MRDRREVRAVVVKRLHGLEQRLANEGLMTNASGRKLEGGGVCGARLVRGLNPE